MNVMYRYLIAAIIVAGIYGIRAFGVADQPTECRYPRDDIHDLPMLLGDWKGKDVPWDPTTSRSARDLSERNSVSRVYRNPTSSRNLITVHMAFFMRADWQLSHPPPVCYSGNGYRIIDNEKVEPTFANDRPTPAWFMTVERDGIKSYVLYWYQLDAYPVLDRDDIRGFAWTLRGKKSWPPRLKVMITCTAGSKTEAWALLYSIGKPLTAWTNAYR